MASSIWHAGLPTAEAGNEQDWPCTFFLEGNLHSLLPRLFPSQGVCAYL